MNSEFGEKVQFNHSFSLTPIGAAYRCYADFSILLMTF